MRETDRVEVSLDTPSEWNKIALFLDACDLTNSEAMWIALQLIDTALKASPSPAREIIAATLARHLSSMER